MFRYLEQEDGSSVHTLTNLNESSTYEQLQLELARLTKWSIENIRGIRKALVKHGWASILIFMFQSETWFST